MRVFFEVFQLCEYLVDGALSFFLFNESLWDDKLSLLIYEVGSAHAARDAAVNTIPLALEVRLNLLQSIQSTHLLLGSLRRLGFIPVTRGGSSRSVLGPR